MEWFSLSRLVEIFITFHLNLNAGYVTNDIALRELVYQIFAL